MLKETFAERLKTAMDLQGKKQVDLIRIASQQGVKLGKSHISQYVNGKTLPRGDILHFLAETLQVEEEWLMGKENQTNQTRGERKMREFKKSSKLDNVLYDVRGPVVDEAERMEDAGMQILKLNIGNPAPFGFKTPDEVIYDMRRQLTDCEGYSSAKGLFSARKAIMQYAQLKNIPNVEIGDIYTGNGVSELINLSTAIKAKNND